MPAVTGLHHVTLIAGDPADNLRFYTDVLGLRLVKRSVNQDAPDTYHLFYADGAGSPGTDITFFPWPAMGPGRAGTGLTMEVGLAVPTDGLDYWRERLEGTGIVGLTEEQRFGERALVFSDPQGIRLALVEAGHRAFVPWTRSPVPEQHQIRGLHGVRLWEREIEPTTEFLVEGLGLTPAGQEGDWRRFSAVTGSGSLIDVRALPDVRRGAWGVGSVHHVAWRTPTPESQIELRGRLIEAGQHPTEVIDRFWFKSIYFKEPGGALFEIATDGPGFAIDEGSEALGERLILPPWLESSRAVIEAALPTLPDLTWSR